MEQIQIITHLIEVSDTGLLSTTVWMKSGELEILEKILEFIKATDYGKLELSVNKKYDEKLRRDVKVVDILPTKRERVDLGPI